VALVTGASRGIGKACAVQLAKAGFDVAVTARTIREGEEREHSSTLQKSDTRPLPGSLGSTAELIAAEGRESLVLPADLLDRVSLGATVATVLERWGRIDVLVNRAGVDRHALFKDEDPETFVRLMETNYLGVVWAIRAVLPAMRARAAGWIVNVSSVAGKLGQPDESALGDRFAVTGYLRGARLRRQALGIHVVTVYPALVRTEMFTPDVSRMPERVQRTFIEPAGSRARCFAGSRAARAMSPCRATSRSPT
jgi:NAD(P)-dependent dehydrogenase (short-subunit alcohol dehydrogenase family)